MVMILRSLLVATIGASLLLLGGAASDPVLPNEPWLELPEAGQRVAVDSSIVLEQAPGSIQRLVLRIPAGGSRINYGTIHTKVNTESADVAMKSSNGMDGFTLNVDLTGAGGFPMLAGRNSVELEYQDEFGRAKYYNFLLDFSQPIQSQVAADSTSFRPSAPGKRAGRLFAVAIGISHYARRRRRALTIFSMPTATRSRCWTSLNPPQAAA